MCTNGTIDKCRINKIYTKKINSQAVKKVRPKKVAAICWPPPLISQLFSPRIFKAALFFYSLAIFTTSFCNCKFQSQPMVTPFNFFSFTTGIVEDCVAICIYEEWLK